MRYITYTELDKAGVLTVTEAAYVLRIGRTKAYELVQSGQIKTLPFASPIRISALWLKSFIESSDVPVDGPPLRRSA